MTDPGQERRAATFPILSDRQLARLTSCGKRRTTRVGEILFERGDIDLGFFVILEGELEVVEPGEDSERLVVVHGPGQFTGEANMLTGRP